MAKNIENEVVEQKNTNKAKPFLVAGLILLGVSLAIGAGWLLTSSIVLLRNSIFFSVTAGLGIGAGSAVVKVISNAVAKRKQNSQNRQITLNRENTRENEQTLNNKQTKENELTSTLEGVPVYTDPVSGKYDLNDPMLFGKVIEEHKKNNQKK